MTSDQELEQRRRNVEVMDLLTKSYEAYVGGDEAEANIQYAAAFDHDAQAAIVITGGIRIGEVPSPETDFPEWIKYVETNREALATAEARISEEGIGE